VCVCVCVCVHHTHLYTLLALSHTLIYKHFAPGTHNTRMQELESVTAIYQSTQEQSASASAALEAAQFQCKSAKAECETLTHDLATKSEALAHTTEQLHRAERERKELVQSTTQSIARLETALALAQDEAGALADAKIVLTSELKMARQRIEDGSTRNTALQSQVDTRDAEIEHLQEQLKRASSAIQAADSRSISLEAQVETLSDANCG
jgi:chromosome segregation ATPase